MLLYGKQQSAVNQAIPIIDGSGSISALVMSSIIAIWIPIANAIVILVVGKIANVGEQRAGGNGFAVFGGVIGGVESGARHKIRPEQQPVTPAQLPLRVLVGVGPQADHHYVARVPTGSVRVGSPLQLSIGG